MKTRTFHAAALSATVLGLLVALSTTAAIAQPSGKAAALFPRPQPPASSPQLASKAAVDCGCAMMKGDAAMQHQCMAMMVSPPGDADKSGSPG
jgi:hypothetical protein